MLNTTKKSWRTCFSMVCLTFALSACDFMAQQLGIEDQSLKEARLEADGKAVGGGCRQSGRALEDCYSVYAWLPRAAVYEGWRDMDSYMRENNIETVTPQLPPVEPPKTKKRNVPKERADSPKATEKADEKVDEKK